MTTCWMELLLLLILHCLTVALTTEHTVAAMVLIEKYACFNTVFEISCNENELLIFDSVRYGRNDTLIASRCDVPFSWNCDIDVHFQINRACAGRRHCSIDVNVALFTDPCGYEEFLRVTYQCVAASKIQSGCSGQQSLILYDHGYISSPNYPDKYYMDAVCRWTLSVRKWQTIRVTLLDFELDVKRGGTCDDYLEIVYGSKEYFRECGVLGKQTIEVPASATTVQFVTGETSLTQRGFFLYFEAVGPGCPDLPDPGHGRITYHIDDDEALHANASCDEGFRFSGYDDLSVKQIRCTGFLWNGFIPECELAPPATSSSLPRVPADLNSSADSNTSIISLSIHYGIALTLVSSVLVVLLASLLAIYCYKRRRNHQKLDKWRVVINNLQENSRPGGKHFPPERSCHLANDSNDTRRFLGKTHNSSSRFSVGADRPNHHRSGVAICPEDEWQGRKLLASRDYSDEDEVEVAFSFTSGHRGSHDLFAMAPIFWQPDVSCKFCSLPPDTDETDKRVPNEPHDGAIDSGKTRPPGSKECGVFQWTSPVEIAPVASVRAVVVPSPCSPSQPRHQRPWPQLRALSKSAPDVTLVDVYPSFLCYSSFVELDSNTSWHCNECLGRSNCSSNHHVCHPTAEQHTVTGVRRCSTVATMPHCSSPTHLRSARKTTFQCTTNEDSLGYRVS